MNNKDKIAFLRCFYKYKPWLVKTLGGNIMEKENLIKCDECEFYKSTSDFYKIITNRKNQETDEYECYTICKKCLTNEYLSFKQDEKIISYRDRIAIKYICEKYNIYFNYSVANRICNDENIKSDIKLGKYLKEISSLPQYSDKEYKDSILTERQFKSEKVKEWTDIEFLNSDIKNVKLKIIKSIEKDDVNAHNKWQNSLRDAFLLRERLMSTTKPTYNLYYDLECRENDNLFKCTIYFKDKISVIVGDCSYITTYITSLCCNENVNIYGDTRGFGIALADMLKEVGYVVQPTTITIFDITKNICGKEIKQDYSKSR